VQSRSALVLRMGLAMVASIALFAGATIPDTLITRGLFLVVMLCSFAILSWFYILSPDERKFAFRALRPSRVTPLT